METRPTAFRWGAGGLLFTGVAHTGATLASSPASATDAATAEAWRVLSLTPAPSPGVAHTLADFYQGDALGMGVVILGLGALGLVVQPDRRVTAIYLATTLALLGVSIAWFPAPPIAVLALSSVAFGAALTR